MNFQKLFLIGFLVLFFVLITLGIVFKKDFHIEKEIIINKNHEDTFQFLKYLKNHDRFTVWGQKDPEKKISEIGEDGKVGYIYKWESELPDLGKGEQEIIAIEEGVKISYEHRFKVPREATYHSFLVTVPEAESTRVIWNFGGNLSFPLNLILIFLNYEETLGEDFQASLKNLKELLENTSN
ncbi:MAG: SRPBCC family protein [Leptospiraceae bacterium]|nr:SRPBCC family protein [Leptospiraceae bacterium]